MEKWKWLAVGVVVVIVIAVVWVYTPVGKISVKTVVFEFSSRCDIKDSFSGPPFEESQGICWAQVREGPAKDVPRTQKLPVGSLGEMDGIQHPGLVSDLWVSLDVTAFDPVDYIHASRPFVHENWVVTYEVFVDPSGPRSYKAIAQLIDANTGVVLDSKTLEIVV